MLHSEHVTVLFTIAFEKYLKHLETGMVGRAEFPPRYFPVVQLGNNFPMEQFYK